MAERPDDVRVEALEARPVFRAEPHALYVVATPLGNLRDVTLRALDILRSVDVIAAEDTRVSARLLQHYGIAKAPQALHAHNERSRAEVVVRALAAGRSVALITDAGTPGISDPGAKLVDTVRKAGWRVVPIPGPTALAAALSAAGLFAEHFAFLGFLPTQTKLRNALLDAVSTLPLALVIYEAPHRVRATAALLCTALGGDRRLVIARELTKTFETITELPLRGAEQWFAADANRERGEFVLCIDAPVVVNQAEVLSAELERWLAALLAELPPARAARIVASVGNVAREAVYNRALALQAARRGPT